MKTTEYNDTRLELIKWISSLNDKAMLNLINSIRMSRKGSKKDWWDSLTPEEKENIELGLKDLEKGKVLASSEFWKKLKNGQTI